MKKVGARAFALLIAEALFLAVRVIAVQKLGVSRYAASWADAVTHGYTVK